MHYISWHAGPRLLVRQIVDSCTLQYPLRNNRERLVVKSGLAREKGTRSSGGFTYSIHTELRTIPIRFRAGYTALY